MLSLVELFLAFNRIVAINLHVFKIVEQLTALCHTFAIQMGNVQCLVEHKIVSSQNNAQVEFAKSYVGINCVSHLKNALIIFV